MYFQHYVRLKLNPLIYTHTRAARTSLWLPCSRHLSAVRVPTPINRHAVTCTPQASGFSLILLHTDNHISSNKKYTTTTTTTTTLDYYQFSWLKIVHVLNNH